MELLWGSSEFFNGNGRRLLPFLMPMMMMIHKMNITWGLQPGEFFFQWPTHKALLMLMMLFLKYGTSQTHDDQIFMKIY